MNNFTSNQNAQGEVKSDRKLRIGIIGTGGIAGSHIASYKKQPDVGSSRRRLNTRKG